MTGHPVVLYHRCDLCQSRGFRARAREWFKSTVLQSPCPSRLLRRAGRLFKIGFKVEVIGGRRGKGEIRPDIRSLCLALASGGRRNNDAGGQAGFVENFAV